MSAGTFETLAEIHRKLFEEIYYFAGKLREENISKGNLPFASALYLFDAVKNREGNGRSMRLWLDHIFKIEIKKVVDWSLIDKNIFMKGLDASYFYENYFAYRSEDL